MAGLLRITTAIAGLCTLALSSRVRAELVVTIQADKSEYALTEPVRLSVRYKNAGAGPVNIMPSRELGANMTCTFYEVTEPNGTVVKRSHQFAYVEPMVFPHYPGDVLLPSDYIEVTMYPALSSSIPGEHHQRRGFTFASVGDYELRLAYAPPPTYRLLAQNTPVYSNVLSIRVRAATDTEKEILDAFWSGDRSDLAMGDASAYITIDEKRTRETLAEYADHPLADFLRLNLARGLMKPGRVVDDEIVAILEELRPKESFRWEEVHMLLGSVYSTLGDRQRALDVFYEALQGRPDLLHNDIFMKRVAFATTGSAQKELEWEFACGRGERMRAAAELLPQQVLRSIQEK